MRQVESLNSSCSSSGRKKIRVHLHRVAFFLEPAYLTQPSNFSETHTARMLRKFGSKEAFERVKVQQALIPRMRSVCLTADEGYTQDNLDRRLQSSTLDSHRLVYFVSKQFGLDVCEKLYDILNVEHFTKSGVLSSKDLLLGACRQIGLPSEDVDKCAEFLSSDKFKAEIIGQYERVTALGIEAIPTVVVDGRYIVSVDEVSDTILEIIANGGEPTGRKLFS